MIVAGGGKVELVPRRGWEQYSRASWHDLSSYRLHMLDNNNVKP